MTTDTEDLLWRRFNEWFRARRPDYPAEWDAYQAGHAAAKAAAVASEGRWYMLANDGMATLCASEADALAEAADADAAWPRKAPHRAVQLVPAEQLAAAVAAERERCARVCERSTGAEEWMLQVCADAIRSGK